jgi:hypothetical protein
VEKGGGLQAEEHHPNHEAHLVRVLCCRRDRCTSIMREDIYVDILKQDLKTSVRKLKLGSSKYTMTPSILPKLKWLKDNKVKEVE